MSDWISVKDRLPKFDKPVIGFIADTKPEFMDYAIEIVSLNSVTERGNLKLVEFRGNDYREHEISHWMPLPKPPKQ